jgi:uncharacterized protein YabN with tetrapyrrole methylase and pyrophosphatase domain
MTVVGDDVFKKLELLEKQAAEFGFAWPNENTIIRQIISECEEIQQELTHDPLMVSSKNKLQEEIGDLLHAAFSLCVFCGFDAQETLDNSVNKFERRFVAVKQLAAKSYMVDLKGLPFAKLMEFWEQAKTKG